MQSDESAIHYLSKNPELVKDIDASIQSIKQGTESFNQNMEALKTNFLFKKYFKKLEKN
ncbi:hypothetical protein [Aquimarina agarivorans]|uniref:hypothetical protein n=1 Tax=Aquimarina agarivorans TaxID=980584 RepID=UPI0002E81727|nr:hypothetical protein [Aquimarina agarivorans]